MKTVGTASEDAASEPVRLLDVLQKAGERLLEHLAPRPPPIQRQDVALSHERIVEKGADAEDTVPAAQLLDGRQIPGQTDGSETGDPKVQK